MAFDFDTYHRFRTSRDIAAEVIYSDETVSTMDDARKGAAEGGIPGTAYVAGAQTGGRGRMGHTWASEGAGLYVTFHLIARDAITAPLFSVAGSLAVADAVRETSRIVPDLKWPNDVLHGGRKLSGILAESVLGSRVDVFLGIGINVRAGAYPPELAGIATSIEEAGAPPPPNEELLAALAAALERHTAQLARSPAVVVAEWRRRLTTLGRHVRLAAVDGKVFEGVAIDVSSRGEIVLRHDDGTEQSFAAGDVTTA